MTKFLMYSNWRLTVNIVCGPQALRPLGGTGRNARMMSKYSLIFHESEASEG